MLFPLEFYLPGTPISLQASAVSRKRWKNEVREAARQRVQESVEWAYLDEGAVALAIYYFPTTPMIGDIDNSVKPIMDALTGVAYLDDQFVERVVAQRFEPGAGWTFAEPSEQLAAALNTIAASDNPTPLVYVRADNDLSWRTL
ncbi:MAG: RusA family crossover junction endodeoxyribonuclease [Reyranellaceae bacterium]